MILKSYQLNKINYNNNNFVLFYGKNEGLKKEELEKIKLQIKKNVFIYEEKQILENQNLFLEEILNKSLFDDSKIIIINRASDKLTPIIEELKGKKIEESFFLINAGLLEKKSKLRNLFEKDKKFICVPFYQDSDETLINLTHEFFKKIKIAISSADINFIINKCNGDRENLKNELIKVELFLQNKKKLVHDDLIKLINLSENYEIGKLIDNCLAKNIKLTMNILNENVFSGDETITIIRIFLNKSKRLLNLLKNFEKDQNIEKTLSSVKPPVFWKDKEIVKKQINKWSIDEVKDLISDINEVELKIKKNSLNSTNFITNFLIEKSA
tara:strand:- start:2368 stop:3348 length:981 start_codon:yes stop_codon:yes gene_type:complete